MSTALVVQGVIVEQTLYFSLGELCRACRAEAEQLMALVEEGVLEPAGNGPEDWQFAGPSLRRAHTALRLTRDLELNPAATALVLDLLDEIEALRSRLRRAGLE
ncbi:MAG: MerR family transcriptional regulator [Burkholderiaceae bacterium]|nr:MerR family transcriptional regulator [Burkholderiaceae bacterium]